VPGGAARKFVLDTHCFIDAAGDAAAAQAFETFCSRAAPGLYLSSVVPAEPRAGARSAREREVLERQVLEPFVRRGRILTPSAASWEALGTVMSWLAEHEGARLSQLPRSFAFDVLVAHSCREAGAVLISRNTRDMARISKVFAFEHAARFPVVR
jgi:predicted nucleic acid-binding protein